MSPTELDLIARIERGEEAAFERLVDTSGASLLRMARHYTPTQAVAEEVVQETWMGFLRGLQGFEGRSSLKTWLFGILLNRARKTAERERRSVSLSDLRGEPDSFDEVSPDRFMPAGQRWAGHWRLDDFTAWPKCWSDLPEGRLLSQEVLAEIASALEGLPANQRSVFTLRDVEGFTAAETCALLGLTDANQRVLLHRARSKVREHLERYLER